MKSFEQVEKLTGTKYSRKYQGIYLSNKPVMQTELHSTNNSWDYYVELPNFHGARLYQLNLHYLECRKEEKLEACEKRIGE